MANPIDPTFLLVLPEGPIKANIKKLSMQGVDISIPVGATKLEFANNYPVVVLINTALQKEFPVEGRVLLARKKEDEWYLTILLSQSRADNVPGVEQRKSERFNLEHPEKPKAFVRHSIFPEQVMNFEVRDISSHGMGLFCKEKYSGLFLNLMFAGEILTKKEGGGFPLTFQVKNVRAAKDCDGFFLGVAFVESPKSLLVEMEKWLEIKEKKHAVFEKEWEATFVVKGSSVNKMIKEDPVSKVKSTSVSGSKAPSAKSSSPDIVLSHITSVEQWRAFLEAKLESFRSLGLVSANKTIQNLLKVDDTFALHCVVCRVDEQKVLGGGSFIPSSILGHFINKEGIVPEKIVKGGYVELYGYFISPKVPPVFLLEHLIQKGKSLAKSADLNYLICLVNEGWKVVFDKATAPQRSYKVTYQGNMLDLLVFKVKDKIDKTEFGEEEGTVTKFFKKIIKNG